MKYVLSILLILSLAANVFFLRQLNRPSAKNELNEKYKLDDQQMLQNEVMQLVKTENGQLATKEKIKDENSNESTLSDVIGNKRKIVFRFSRQHCPDCANAILRQLINSPLGTRPDDVLLLTTGYDQDSLKVIKKRVDFIGHIYSIQEAALVANKAEEQQAPYFFIVRPDGSNYMTFFPKNALSDLTRQYLDEAGASLK